MTVTIRIGDCLDVLRALPPASVHCCVTSPPYYALRDYGHDGQIGLEETPDAFVAKLVDVFREVRRVLRDDGTLWCNLGDSYSQKEMLGMPWRVAFALQADGWYLRQDIVWHKPNPMPESVRDRCTKAHEYIFLLSKSPRYYFDAVAIKELAVEGSGPGIGGWATGDGDHTAVSHARGDRSNSHGTKNPRPSVKKGGFGGKTENAAQPAFRAVTEVRNKRSVWTVPTFAFPDAHFATFPPKLIEPCILAGCPEGGTVLDPFGGAGTTGLVADRLHRNALLIEINPEYAAMARRRIRDDSPLFADLEANATA